MPSKTHSGIINIGSSPVARHHFLPPSLIQCCHPFYYMWSGWQGSILGGEPNAVETVTERATWFIPRALKRILTLLYNNCTPQVATIIAVEEVSKRRFWQDSCFKIGQRLAVFEIYVKILLGYFGIRLKWPDIWHIQKMWLYNDLLTDEQTAVHCLASDSGLNKMYNCMSPVFAYTSGKCFPSALNSSLTYFTKSRLPRVKNLVAYHRWNQCVLVV